MKTIKTFFLSLLPVLLWLFVQVVVSAGVIILFAALPVITTILDLNTIKITTYFGKEYVYIASIWMSVVFWIPGVLWYRSLSSKNQQKKNGSFKEGIRIVLFGMFIQLAVSAVLVVVAIIFPQTMEEYGQVMESLGMGQPSIWSVLYVGILAPITEELVFRGLTMKLLLRTCTFPVANVIQAIYFGIIHGNIIQGIYAFLIGLCLGKLVQKYGTIKSSILCHMAVNFSGVILGIFPMSIFSMAIGAVILAFIMTRLKDKDTNIA